MSNEVVESYSKIWYNRGLHESAEEQEFKAKEKKMDEESEPISNEALEAEGLLALAQDRKRDWELVSLRSTASLMEGVTLHELLFKAADGIAQRLVLILTDTAGYPYFAQVVRYQN